MTPKEKVFPGQKLKKQEKPFSQTSSKRKCTKPAFSEPDFKARKILSDYLLNPTSDPALSGTEGCSSDDDFVDNNHKSVKPTWLKDIIINPTRRSRDSKSNKKTADISASKPLILRQALANRHPITKNHSHPL